MATERRFTRFGRGERPLTTREIPDGGICLSAFLVISKRGKPGHVLLGRLNSEAHWDHIGALDPERAEVNSRGWILPSSHLILGESPQDAGRRILREQLGGADLSLEAPVVFSEVYGPKDHWDIDFIFLGEADAAPANAAWKELRFVDLARVTKEEMARSNEDILAHVGRWKAT